MTWSDFYLICFAVGFLLSAFSFIAGGMRWHLHLPHFPHSTGHVPVGHGTGTHGHAGATEPGKTADISPLNFVTFTAFLAWFGGTGFMITRFSSVWYALGLLYEQYGARAAALDAYGRVEAHELDDHSYIDPVSTYVLAQARIKALNSTAK